MSVESKLDKIARQFQRKLTEDEIKFRLDSTRVIVTELRQAKEWKDYITDVRVFGSMVKGAARTGSDVDLAILTDQKYFLGMDFSFISNQIMVEIERIKQRLGYNKLKIGITLISNSWLIDLDKADVTDREALREIIKDGVGIDII